MKDPRETALEFVTAFGLRPFNDAPKMREWIENAIEGAVLEAAVARSPLAQVAVDDGQYRAYDCGCSEWRCPAHLNQAVRS